MIGISVLILDEMVVAARRTRRMAQRTDLPPFVKTSAEQTHDCVNDVEWEIKLQITDQRVAYWTNR